MIAKAKAISHGINGIRYINGESHNKKHPEKIHRIMDNLLPSHLDAMGIWNSMLFTLSAYKNMKNSLIRIELSPSPEHTKYFTPANGKTFGWSFLPSLTSKRFRTRTAKSSPIKHT